MKKLIILLAVLASAGALSAQHVALKNNLLGDAMLSPNLGIEVGLGKKTTLDLYGSYNWFEYSKGKQMKHWLVQPELRYWLCDRFNGTFFGLHVHGGEMNVAGYKLPFGMFPGLEHNRYEGYFYGAGLSVGHQWILGRRWSLEATVGAGYARIHYDRYDCIQCGPKSYTGNKNYFGITKASVAVIFFIH